MQKQNRPFQQLAAKAHFKPLVTNAASRSFWSDVRKAVIGPVRDSNLAVLPREYRMFRVDELIQHG